MKTELIDYETHLAEVLEDQEVIEEYLNEALKEKDLKVFLIALRSIAKARKGGIAGFAKTTGYSRGTVYKTLSEKGNPTFGSLNNFISAAGFQLRVERIEPEKKKRKPIKKELVPA